MNNGTLFKLLGGAVSLGGLIYLRRKQVELNRLDAKESLLKAGEYLQDVLCSQYEAEQWFEQERCRIYEEPRHTDEQLLSGDIFLNYSNIFELKFICPQEERTRLDTLCPSVDPDWKGEDSKEATKRKEQMRLGYSIYLNYKSNLIEGSTLSLSETETLIRNGTACEKPIEHLLDAFNHQKAWSLLPTQNVSWRPEIITDQFILDIHSKMMAGSEEVNPGQYRKQFVKIKGSKVLLPHPKEVPALMNRLLDWLHSTHLHPIDVVVNFHQYFIRIHPFADGNGRVCRLLCSFISMMGGYSPIGFFTISRSTYFDAIRQWEQEANTLPFGQLMWSEVEESMKRWKLNVPFDEDIHY
eukprot:TRINITY_DN17947_c0_g1_i1.p1 TRINITY_DN17947_c0_g1~~TRINITY_DN17947_c0_g1_i1.p1  ORF type:complete len:354 (+),score=51.57 TRINITY_DN17947_c0_g1_i1:78-1139(+)